MLLHTLHKNIRGFRHGVLLTEYLSLCFQQTDGRYYTLLLLQVKPTALRSCFHSAQFPGPMSMALSGEGDSEVSRTELTYVK
jgi:hypothetical protein